MKIQVAVVVAGLAMSACGVEAQDRVESALCRDSVVGEVEIGDGWSQGLFVHDGYMFEVKEHELHVFDVHEIESPVLVRVYSIENIHGVTAVVDGHLYSVGAEQVLVHDLSDPFDVREVSRFEYPFGGYGIAASVEGSQVLMTNGDFVRLIDFSDFSHPVELFAQASAAPSFPVLLRSGSLVLYGGGGGEVGVYELDDELGLVFVGESDVRFTQQSAVFVDGYLVTTGGGGWFEEPVLRVYEMSDPLEPVLVGEFYAKSGSLQYIEEFGVLLVRGLGELVVWDVTDVLEPVKLGSVANERWNMSSTVSDGSLIWSSAINSSDGIRHGLMRVADLSLIGDTQVQEIELPQGMCKQIEITDGVAYVLERVLGGDSRIQLFDVQDPLNPVERGFIDLDIGVERMRVEWPLVYTANGQDGVTVLDVSDPDRVAVLSETGSFGSASSHARNVCVTGDVMFVANDDELFLFDVSDPAQPVVLRSLDITAQSIHAHEGMLFVVVRGAIMSFDISEPSDPVLASVLDGTRHSYRANMLVRDGRLFVSDDFDPIREYIMGPSGELSVSVVHGLSEDYLGGMDIQDHLLVVQGPAGVHVYDFKPGEGSTYRGSMGEYTTQGFALHDEYVYMLTNDHRMVIHDLSTRCGDCPADLNGDGVLSFFDVAAFMAAFHVGDASVDLNGDGSIDFYDVAAYLDLYGAGCG